MVPRYALPTLLLSFALLASCSDSDDDDTVAVGAPGAPATTPFGDEPPPADPPDLVTPPDEDAGTPDDELDENDLTLPAEDVDAFIERFEREREQVGLEFDGTRYPISLLEQDEEAGAFILRYPLGVVLMGFDFENDVPTSRLELWEGELTAETSSLEAFEAILTRRLVGSDITLEEDAMGNLVYRGRVRDESTQGEFDVRLVVNGALNGGDSELSFEGDEATLNGSLGAATYVQVRDMIANRPDITRLVLDQVRGSIDDNINLHTGRLVRAAGLETHVPATGDVNSGGVDLFVSGTRRTVDEGGILAVHSGCCIDGAGFDTLPRSHPVHEQYIAYHEEMLGEAQGEPFHFFTIEAAPPEFTRPMTREEMVRFGVVTE